MTHDTGRDDANGTNPFEEEGVGSIQDTPVDPDHQNEPEGELEEEPVTERMGTAEREEKIEENQQRRDEAERPRQVEAPLQAVIVASNEPFNKDSEEWHCCCGLCHVDRGARIIAIAGSVIKTFSLIFDAFTAQWFGMVIAAVGLLMYLMILLAQWKRNPKFYLPYLIINTIYIIAMVVVIILVVSAAIAVSTSSPQQYNLQQTPYGMPLVQQTPYGMAPQYSGSQYNTAGSSAMLWLAAFLMVVDVILSAWFQWIVRHAYKYMKASHMLTNGQVGPIVVA